MFGFVFVILRSSFTLYNVRVWLSRLNFIHINYLHESTMVGVFVPQSDRLAATISVGVDNKIIFLFWWQ